MKSEECGWGAGGGTIFPQLLPLLGLLHPILKKMYPLLHDEKQSVWLFCPLGLGVGLGAGRAICHHDDLRCFALILQQRVSFCHTRLLNQENAPTMRLPRARERRPRSSVLLLLLLLIACNHSSTATSCRDSAHGRLSQGVDFSLASSHF